ncbi:hypothetical protein GCM10023199_40400 [Actinomycetospora chibensis]
MRVVALQAHVDDEQHAGALLVFEHVTTGFGWSRLGRSALFATTVYTVLPAGDDAEGARRWVETVRAALPSHIALVAGIGAPSVPMSLPASRREADESLALHAARHDAPAAVYDESWDRILLRRLRSIARTGVSRRGVPSPNCDGMTSCSAPATSRPSGPGWGRTATSPSQRLSSTCTRTPCATGLRKINGATHLAVDQPEQRLAMIIALAATEHDQD